MALQSFTFDNVPSTNYNLVISSGGGLYNAPARDVEKVAVPGRNGDLIIDNGKWSNISVTYPVFVMEDVLTNVDNFRQFVMTHSDKYYILKDTYHPTEFRKARFSGDFVAAMFQGFLASSFSVVFDCEPQRYLTIGQTVKTFDEDGSITNPTNFDAEPIIEVFGTGNVTINGYSIDISSDSQKESIVIDSELMDCYSGTENMNSFVSLSLGFPKLSPGANGFTLGENITQIKITPRWWRL